MNGIGLDAANGEGPGNNGPSFSFFAFVAPSLLEGGVWKVETAELHIADPTAAGDLALGEPANNWGIQLTVAGQPLDTAGGITNNGQVIPTNVSYQMPVQGPEDINPRNVFLAPGDVVSCVGTKVGSGRQGGNLDLSPYNFHLTLYLRQSPPGR